MKYKWKDKVRIKSKKELECISEVTDDMLKNGGAIMTIACLVEDADGYIMKEDGDFHFLWSDEMIEGLVEEETKFGTASKPIEIKSNANCLTRERVDELATKIDKELPSGNQNVWELPEGYQFVDENGNVINAQKIVLEKKKKEYPKTYEECCKIMQVARPTIWFDYDDVSSISEEGDEYERHIENTLCAFRKLLICRDAYWKIAGEEMRLGKPWEPDLLDDNQDKFVLANWDDNIEKYDYRTNRNYILTFPTEEMRDVFKENFDPDIEICKEFL